MKKLKNLLLVALFALPLFAFKAYMPAEPSADQFVKFHVKNAGITIDGFFADFDANVSYDASDVSSASFSGSIDVKSIDTGIEMRDEHLVGEEYFDASNHPKISFKSNSVTKMSDGKLKVKGTLSIKGNTESVEMMVSIINQNGKTYFKTTLELDRLDYEVGESSWVLSDDVTCELKIAM